MSLEEIDEYFKLDKDFSCLDGDFSAEQLRIIAEEMDLLKGTESTINKDKLLKLWDVVCSYVKKESIGCAETIYQCKNVILSSCKFIQDCCDVVGYCEENEGD